jgi:carotenoid cleavage dioxygenase
MESVVIDRGGDPAGEQPGDDGAAARGVENPFLTGIHAPMREELTLTALAVEGAIPAGLDGRYLRIGPNPAAKQGPAYHPFTGDGMVHGVALSGGKAVWYRNRWIRSAKVAEALGVEAAPGPLHRFGTVNTNVMQIGGETYALVEAGSYPVALGETLDAQRYDPFGGTLHGSFSGHPHLDPLTGECHAICYDIGCADEIRHVSVDARGQVLRELPIPVSDGPMIHDCALTGRFVIILDFPVTMAAEARAGGNPFPYRWNTAHPARVGLLPRQGTAEDIIWCEVAPSFAFHVVNAFDRADGKVVLDLCVYRSMFTQGMAGMGAEFRALERWVLDPAGRSCETSVIDLAVQEFPRMDDRFFGQEYRYAWTMAMPDETSAGGALYAYDLQAGSRLVHDFGAGRLPGEFVFIPETPESAEGEGWLAGLVIDYAHETTDLVILDARRFEAAPVASVHLPHRVPPGFHGNWIAATCVAGVA